MPYAKKVCGIYGIFTPNGSLYVGSSINIFHRWAEHRCNLKRGKHHSSRLQAAYRKHVGGLEFKIIEECAREILNEREQYYIDRLGAELNTSAFVENVWLNDETREKFRRLHSSFEWREMRREISSRPRPGWVSVECSDGRTFPSLTLAAKAFGIRASGIKHLVVSQWRGRLGVRFKRTSDEWLPEKSLSEKLVQARKRNGTDHHSEETKKKMREHRARWKPSWRAHEASIEAVSRPVVGRCRTSGTEMMFKSAREAARLLRPDNYRTAGAQINKAIRGVKRNAYGYDWKYAVSS